MKLDLTNNLKAKSIRPRHARRRNGYALLICMFVLSMCALLSVRMLDVQTAQCAMQRNTRDYERALYLANAGVHHGLAMLETTPSWRSTVSEGSYPANGSYTATAVDGTGGAVVVTGVGVSGAVRRTLQATIIPGN